MNNMFLQLKRVFSKLTPFEMMATELSEAELSALEHQSAVEYHKAIVDYNQARIARLRTALNSHAKSSSSI